MLITNFSSGELSKKLAGRVDLQQYFQGAGFLENFEIIPTGGIERRRGTKRLAKLSGPCRLIPFIIDKDNSFILEITPGITYIWKDGEKYYPQETVTNPYENMLQIDEIQYAQNYDTLIFCQSNHTPVILKYDFTRNLFDTADMTFNYYPDIQLDDDYNYIIYKEGSESLPVGEFDGQYGITAGRLWKWSADKEQWEDVEPDLNERIDTHLFTRYEDAAGVENYQKCPSAVTFFNSRLWFASNIESRQKVWASAAPDTSGQRYNDFSTWKKYVTVNKVVKNPDIHIFTAEIRKVDIDEEANTTILRNVSQDFTKEGKLKKNYTDYYVYNNTYVPGATKVAALTADTITLPVALNLSWGDEETVKYGITFNLSLWVDPTSASADDYEFEVIYQNLTTSDCSFNFEVASDQNDAVKWIGANKYMTVGTESSVWCIPSSVTALNIAAEMAGRYGSDQIQGHCVDTAMIFFAQGKCGIREYYYDTNAEAFRTNNIAVMADQMLTEAAAKEFDFITNPYNRIVITREDGNIVALLYDKNNGVMGWNRLKHGNAFIFSTAITRGNKDTDLMYLAVREGEGETASYYLEILDPNENVFLDSWEEYTEDNEDYSPDAVIYNATTDKILEDGDDLEDFMSEGDEVYIGYNYESVISSMPVIANDPTGKKRITYLLVRFNDSAMPVLSITGVDDEHFYDVEEPYSGIKQITYPGISDRDVTFTIRTSKPKCCNILAVNAALA